MRATGKNCASGLVKILEDQVPMIHLDTHVVVWLYDGRSDLIPKGTLNLLEKEDLGISPAVILELEYLFESRKVTQHSNVYVSDLSSRIGMVLLSDSFESVIWQSVQETWTRDPFDRLIVAQAELTQAKLITKDRIIRKNYPKAIWKR